MTAWETYQEQTTETLQGIVDTTTRQIAILEQRPGAEQVLRIARTAHDRAAAELATR